jgi:hypothetical protein
MESDLTFVVWTDIRKLFNLRRPGAQAHVFKTGIQAVKQQADVAQQSLACPCDFHAAAPAKEKLDAEAVFKMRKATADGGYSNAFLLRSANQAPFCDDSAKELQRREVNSKVQPVVVELGWGGHIGLPEVCTSGRRSPNCSGPTTPDDRPSMVIDALR